MPNYKEPYHGSPNAATETSGQLPELPLIFPLHDRAAEEAVIGSLLIDGESLGEVAGFLKPEHFHIQRNRVCFETALDMTARGVALNQVTLSRTLAFTEGLLEQIGGAAYLGYLVYSVPTSVHIADYGRIVADLAARREAMRILTERYNDVPRAVDFQELVAQTSTQLLAIDTPSRIEDRTLKGAMDALLTAYADLDDVTTLRTGITYLDELLLGGFRTKQLVVVGGLPGVGKSAFALHLARLAATEGNGVIYLSMEMGKVEVSERLVAARAGVNVGRVADILAGETEQYQDVFDAVGALSELPFELDDEATANPDTLSLKARQASANNRVKLLVVDHLQLVSVSGSNGNRNFELDVITRTLKSLAMELDICVVSLSQLNRSVSDTKSVPTMSSLRDSGTIGQNADIVILMHEPKSDDSTEDRPKIRFYLAKNRRGRTGNASAFYDKCIQRFEK